jgi:hypothetical protein
MQTGAVCYIQMCELKPIPGHMLLSICVYYQVEAVLRAVKFYDLLQLRHVQTRKDSLQHCMGQ